MKIFDDIIKWLRANEQWILFILLTICLAGKCLIPSVLHMIGCEDPEWRGVGMDLLGDEPRFLNGQQAVELSDKLIQGRYFSK